MKFLKWLLIIVVALFIVTETYILISGNTYLNKLLPLTIFSGKLGPDIDEIDAFNKNPIPTQTPISWAVSEKNYSLSDSIIKQIESYKTVSFLVIKNDTVRYEKHWEGYHDSSLVNSFSMAKSITALLIGCAIKDGLIKSVNDPVANYLNEFNTPELSNITIKHLLTMSSGLAFKEDYASMFSWPAEAYYGPDVNALTLSQAKPIFPAGSRWLYKGGDTQLLGMILKKISSQTVAEYASIKLWKPLGAEQTAFWSLDENGMEKVSCCWYSNAKDFAKLGKLMIQQGFWNGVQLLDSTFVDEAITPCLINDDNGKPVDYYGYQWWLLNYKGHQISYARGIRGQYIFVIPDLKTIVVRLGHKRASKSGDEIPSDVFLYLDAALQLQ